MGDKIRLFTAREVERLLAKYDFEFVSKKGSHRKWRNFTSGLQVIVPFHKEKTLPLGTLKSILKSAEIPEDEWRG